MAGLKDVHETLEEIPEQHRELYTEKDGKWECTGIEGLKTTADVARVQEAKKLEEKRHKETKAKLAVWGEMKHDEVQASLDRLPELEAAGKDKLDEAGIEEIVQKRVDGVLKSRMNPLERQVRDLTKERDELKTDNDGWVGKDRSRQVRSELRKAATAAKVRTEAIDDILDIGERIHELTEDGKVLTKEGVGVTPGMDAAGWLAETQEKRSYWWGDSQGGGSTGSRSGTGAAGGKNPWSEAHWNVTEQGRIVQQHGQQRAEQLARAAGSKVGAIAPTAKKKAS